jgi:glycosyltransferase involved in cell wall biosynthesis
MVSVVIPSRNEPYLKKTIQDLLLKASGQIEIIAVLDGYWPALPEFVNDPKVTYIHFSNVRGMRNAINSGVSIAKGEFILKCDAHVMFEKGFDTVLSGDCQDNYVVVPRRWALDPEKWEIEKSNPKYPIDYMFLDNEYHGSPWHEKNKDEDLKIHVIDDLMSSQGSCWFMRKDYFHELELMDASLFGTFASEFQEVGLKCWLSGGRVVVDKKTWYAHWHKTESRGYNLDKADGQKAADHVVTWMSKKYTWPKQIHDINWLVEKFAPVPTWPT